MKQPLRFDVNEMICFAKALCMAGGMAQAPAADVASVLVEGDLLGHDTHGLQLLASYVSAVQAGTMLGAGEPQVLAERASVLTWDGRRLPGPYLIRRALAWAMPRAREHGTATVVIRRSHHIGCLAAYLEAPARQGLMVSLQCSDPAMASVAPFGGTSAVFTPNPMSWGIPTSADPIIIDVSSSITTNGMSARLARSGARGDHAWWLGADGQVTDDPAVMQASPAGTILPLGGMDAGHKGYGLALQVEALTAGLAGHGRADPNEGQGATVCLQVVDPDAFAGLPEFQRQTDWLVSACHASVPVNPSRPVRLPGERGLARKQAQLAGGLTLDPGIVGALQDKAASLGLTLPRVLA